MALNKKDRFYCRFDSRDVTVTQDFNTLEVAPFPLRFVRQLVVEMTSENGDSFPEPMFPNYFIGLIFPFFFAPLSSMNESRRRSVSYWF